MSNWTEADLADIKRKRAKNAQKDEPTPKRGSKFRNVKTRIGDQVFDSKREAQYWMDLKARERAGLITELARQIPFGLYCPTAITDQHSLVCHYVADFTFKDAAGVRHVVDAKGMRTQQYALKAKWLELQDGIIIEEV